MKNEGKLMRLLLCQQQLMLSPLTYNHAMFWNTKSHITCLLQKAFFSGKSEPLVCLPNDKSVPKFALFGPGMAR